MSYIKFGLLVPVISYFFPKMNWGHMDRYAGKYPSMIKKNLLETKNRIATPQHFYSNNNFFYNIKVILVTADRPWGLPSLLYNGYG